MEIIGDDSGIKVFDECGNVGPAGLYGNGIVIVKVDASGLLNLLFKELSFEAFLGVELAVKTVLIATWSSSRR